MTKLLKVRFLFPLLVLVYVSLGGFVVWRLDRPLGHTILLLLALAALALLFYGIYRYNKYYRVDPPQRKVFSIYALIVVGLVALIIYHIVAILMGLNRLSELYGVDATFAVLAFMSWIIYENNENKRARMDS